MRNPLPTVNLLPTCLVRVPIRTLRVLRQIATRILRSLVLIPKQGPSLLWLNRLSSQRSYAEDVPLTASLELSCPDFAMDDAGQPGEEHEAEDDQEDDQDRLDEIGALGFCVAANEGGVGLGCCKAWPEVRAVAMEMHFDWRCLFGWYILLVGLNDSMRTALSCDGDLSDRRARGRFGVREVTGWLCALLRALGFLMHCVDRVTTQRSREWSNEGSVLLLGVNKVALNAPLY